MKGSIGIRRQSKSIWQKRAPFSPEHVSQLVSQGLQVYIQPSSQRCFTDYQYQAAGGLIQQDLSQCWAIFGVKQVPIYQLIQNRLFVFFSHTIKCQPHNMPLLNAILQKNIQLIDYETITDDSQQRLVAFGQFAGRVGVIDFLNGLGKYFIYQKIHSAFIYIGCSYNYPMLSDVQIALATMKEEILKGGLPMAFSPFIFGVTGTGRCAVGALEILRQLPHQEISPQQLLEMQFGNENKKIFIVSFPIKTMYEREDGIFDRQDFRSNPSRYRSVFAERYMRKLTCIINCIYYYEGQPKIVPTADLRADSGKLIGISDVSCDLEGGVQVCRKFTDPEDPFFLYKPSDDRMYPLVESHAKDSILMFTMDFMPAELPKDATIYFGNKLLRFVKEIAYLDYQLPFANQEYSDPLKKATITNNGQLTEKYQYIQEARNNVELAQGISSVEQDIANIIKNAPDLIGDLQNALALQTLSEQSKQAIIQLSRIYQG